MTPNRKKTTIAAAVAACLALLIIETRSGDISKLSFAGRQSVSSSADTNTTPVPQPEDISYREKSQPVLPSETSVDMESHIPLASSEDYSDTPPLYYIDTGAPPEQPINLAENSESNTTETEKITPLSLPRNDAAINSNGEANIKINSRVPEGFEALAKAQTTFADFYFWGRLIDSAEITFNHEYVEITDPEGLVGRIPGVLAPETIIKALSGPISHNASQICLTGRQTNCGQIDPDIAGVIFNADEFRADIFIAPELLEIRGLDQSKYLPDSSSSLGVIQGLNATTSGVTGTDNDTNNFSLYGNTLVGWKENHLVSEWDVSKNNDFSIDTLYAERDAKGMLYGAGYLSTSTIMTPEFSSGRRILGARIGTSSNSRTDSANIKATPIQVFASGRSRVEVIREDRLIYSAMVEAGNQELDTSSFPNGAYEITVRVYDGSVVTQEFTRFFVKTMRIPPADEFLWYLEGGELVHRDSGEVLPETMDEWLVRGALGVRLTEQASLTMIGSSTSEERTVETETYYQGNSWEMSATGMVGNNDVKGAAFEGRAFIGSLTGNYYFRKLWNNNYDAANAAELLVGTSYESHNLSVSSPLLAGYLTYTLNHNRDQDNDRTTTNSVGWNKNIWHANTYTLSLQLNYSQRRDNKLGLATLTLRNRGRNWNANVRGQSRWEQDSNTNGKHSVGGAADARWYLDQLEKGNAEVGVSYEDLTSDQVLAGDVKYDSSLFGAELNLDHVIANNRDNFSNYNGRLNTTLAFNTDSAGIGGRDLARSAALVSIEGSEQASFDVLVNNHPRGVVRGNGTTVMPLSPFATYQIGIQPRGDGLHHYDISTREITVYPGNVETVSFSSSREEVIIGKLVDNAGNALPGQRISADTDTVITDEFGLFQIRVTEGVNTLGVAVDSDSSCTLILPENYSKRAGIGVVGSVGCEN